MMAAAEYFVRVVVGRAIRFEGQMWDLDSDTVNSAFDGKWSLKSRSDFVNGVSRNVYRTEMDRSGTHDVDHRFDECLQEV